MAEQRRVAIGHADYWIATDADYGKHLGERFEPDTAALLEALCEPDSQILDVGANIGVTAVLFSALAPDGKVAAVEPVPAAFSLLEQNVAAARAQNVRLHNFALGAAEGTVRMQGNPDNLSGSFIADRHEIRDDFHFTQEVPVRRLDDAFGSLGLSRLDVLKVDVEGYELDVLQGAARVLAEHRPIVVLEMNYVALNLWRRMSLPQFRDELLAIFPFVFALQDGRWTDFRDEAAAHGVQFSHLTKFTHMDIVGGFDRQQIERRLARIADARRRLDKAHALADQLRQRERELQDMTVQRDTLAAELAAARQRVHALEHSTSWRLTAPLRALRK